MSGGYWTNRCSSETTPFTMTRPMDCPRCSQTDVLEIEHVLPDGTEVGSASDLRTLEEMLERVPAESLAYHGKRNDFSNWLKARTELALADKLRPVKVSDFASLEDLRESVVRSIAEYRIERHSEGMRVVFAATRPMRSASSEP